jgi:hypothetical protein
MLMFRTENQSQHLNEITAGNVLSEEKKFRVASRIELIRNDAIIQYVSNMSQIYRYGLNHLKYLQIIFFSRRYSQFTFSS